MNITEYLINKLNKEQASFGRLAYTRLSWRDRNLCLPPKWKDLDLETVSNMPVQVVYYMNGGLHTEEYKDLIEALSGMYSHHVWGMAMVGRDSKGNDCLRYESSSASEILSR